MIEILKLLIVSGVFMYALTSTVIAEEMPKDISKNIPENNKTDINEQLNSQIKIKEEL